MPPLDDMRCLPIMAPRSDAKVLIDFGDQITKIYQRQKTWQKAYCLGEGVRRTLRLQGIRYQTNLRSGGRRESVGGGKQIVMTKSQQKIL